MLEGGGSAQLREINFCHKLEQHRYCSLLHSSQYIIQVEELLLILESSDDQIVTNSINFKSSHICKKIDKAALENATVIQEIKLKLGTMNCCSILSR